MNKKLIKVSNALLLTEFKHIFRVMKLTSLFGVLCVSSAFAINVNSQSLRVNIHANQKQAKEVIKQIEEQTDYLFVYNHDKVNLNNTVTIQANNETVAEVLNQMFAGTDIIYAMQGNNILLMQKDAVVQQSGKVVTGTIVDPSGMPVIGANVMVKGTTNGTITDMDGKFSLEVEEGATLQISYIGYANQEIKVGNQKTLSIALKEDAEALDELVVVGYGTMKKENLTGAIAQVSSDVLESKPISNLGQGLQGVIPNLNVTTGSGLPGQGASYNVRGATSITGGGPLILVDGVQMDPNLIAPQDVASISVLKDAASAAIYGARGGYGVILITTKNGGKNDKPTISFSTNLGIYQPTMIPNTPNSMQFVNYINQVAANAGQQPIYNETYMSYVEAYYNDPINNSSVFYDPAANDPKHLNDPTAWSYCGNTDWYSELVHPLSFDQRYNLSLRGGTKNTKYYVSQSFNNNSGLMKYYDDKYQRWNTNMKVSSSITDWLEVGGKIAYNYSNQSLPATQNWGGSGWTNLFLDYLSPFMPVKHPDGNFSGQGTDTNPAAFHELGGYSHTKINDTWLTGNVRITPLEGLTINADYTFNYYSKDVSDFVREYYEYRRLPGTEALYPWTTPNGITNMQNNDYYNAFNIYAQYDRSFAKHNLGVTIGYNYETKANRGFGVERKELISNDVPYIGLASGEVYTRNSGSTEWGIDGMFVRLNYDYDSKYYVSFSGRYDGSSKFPSSHRYAFFPSVSGAWRISSENFMESSKNWLDDLKIRLSYGSLGNQAGVGNFTYFPALGVNSSYGYLMNGSLITTVSAPGLVSNNYTWETIKQVDAGLDFLLFNNRLSGTFDWYQRMTYDMLAPSRPYPETLGTSAPKVNSADMKTRGWEVSLKWQDKIGNLDYHVGFVLSDYIAEITRYYNPTGNIDTWYEGKKVGDIWGYTTVDLFKSPEEVSSWADQSELYGGQWMPGDIKLQDLNGDDKISKGNRTLKNHGDLSVIGNTEPRFNYGITLGGSFKGFDLDVFFQGIGKKDFFPGGQGFWGSYYYFDIPTAWCIENTWTPENQDALLPRPSMGNGYNQQTQSRYKFNAGYLRLKNLTIGYTIPKVLTEKIFINKARIYFSGQNLFCITSLPDIYDPETLGYGTYPVQRVFSFGLDVSF